MAHSTQLNAETIKAQAARHNTMADDVSSQLDQLKASVDATLAASPSGATRALSSTCDNWVESVRSSVLAHLHAMADNMIREANNQGAMDEQQMQTIQNLDMQTGNFLGVS
jgi:hypothetical protein